MLKKPIVLLIAGLFAIASIAMAAPEDWQVQYRSLDDTEYIPLNIPSRATSTHGILGGEIGSASGRWYYIRPSGNLRVDQKLSGVPYPGYELSVEIGDDENIQDLYGKYDALALSKVSTTTYQTAISSINSQLSNMANWAVKSDWNQEDDGEASFIENKPVLSTVAISGSYDDLTDRPATTTPLTLTTTGSGAATYATSTNALNIPVDTYGRAYEGTTTRSNSFRIYKNATVASGVATFHLTADGTSGGTALCTNGIIQDSLDVEVNDAAASYQMSYALSNANKTVTVTANKLTTANILTGLLGQAQANGSVVRLVAECY